MGVRPARRQINCRRAQWVKELLVLFCGGVCATVNTQGKKMNTPEQQPQPLLVRVEEAARLLSLSRSTLYEMLASGELPSVKFGAARRVPVVALKQWVAAHTTNGDMA